MSLLSLTIALSLAATPAIAAAGDLSPLQWEKRIVVIFGSAADPLVAEQRRRLDGETASLEERDLVVVHVDAHAVTTIFGEPGPLDAAALRQRLDQAEDIGFSVVLVGKDGTVKLREAAPVDTAALFALIDSMPMRQSEMGER